MNSVKQIILILLMGLIGSGCRTAQFPGEARIHSAKSSELVYWLDYNRTSADEFFVAAICDELAARREVDFLLESLNASKNEDVRTYLISRVLYQIDDNRVYEDFAEHLSEKETEESYYIANYLAKKGNTAALDTLNRHYFQYPVSSWQWSYTAEIFGKFKYKPAASNLVESLDAASLNLAGAACEALQEIYTDSPSHFKGLSEARAYYIKRLQSSSSAPPDK